MASDGREGGLVPWRERGWWVAVAVGLLAGGHWIFGLSYSRGYDYFLWLYNAWLAASALGQGAWPEWSQFSAAGHPFFKMAGLSDALVFAAFIGPLGLKAGTQVYALALYAGAAGGLYVLARRGGASEAGAVVGAAGYAFSWFFSYTAYFQTYLSNLLSYAMMPWGALLLAGAMSKGSRGQLLAACGLLFVSLTSNAQVSIRFMLFALPLAWLDAVLWGGAAARRIASYSVAFVAIAVCWAAFLIVPALALRGEVLLLSEVRSNWFMPPWAMLFWLPLSGLHLVSLKMGGDGFLDSEILVWAIHSDYLGLSVVAIAGAGVLGCRTRPRVQWLLVLLAAYFVLYFLVVPNLRASAWIGRTHNWAVLPTLVLALLCPYGCDWAARRWSRLRPVGRAGFALSALIVIDLGGASFALNRLGLTHTLPDQLPEVGVWRQVWAQEAESARGRWFTFNPDHTHYLYPILTGRETANVIELRMRNREYDSFVQHQFEAVRSLDASYQPAESLGLLNCRFVDLPLRLFDYRGKVDHYAAGIELLQRDERLTEVARRSWQELDEGYDHSRALREFEDLANERVTGAGVAQVVWRNVAVHWAFVPEKTILLVGNSLAGQRFFEQVTHLVEFRADRLLFILYPQGPDHIDTRVLEAVDAQIVIEGGRAIAGLPTWDIENIAAYYSTPRIPRGQVGLLAEGSREIAVETPGLAEAGFLFLSRQRFRDWKAYGASGQELPAFKAAAGLTAIYLPPANTSVVYRYELPVREKIARIFSLCCAILALAWWGVAAKKGTRDDG